MRYDVIVAGMGPGGASAACKLGQAGLSVLAIDKKSFPRYKPCGGGLSARIRSLLTPDFYTTVDRTIRGIRFSYPGRGDFSVSVQEPIAYMVTRERFDHFLVQKAKVAGVELRESEILMKLKEGPDGVEVITNAGQYQAKVLVGADGAHSVAAKFLNPNLPRRKILALEEEIPLEGVSPDPESSLKSDEVFIDLGSSPGGYAWSFPKAARLSVGIAGFSGQDKSLLQHFSIFKASQHMQHPSAKKNWVGHPLPLFDPRCLTLASRRVLLVGDAANLVDPFLGEGIFYAVRSGLIAADSIVEGLDPKWVDCTPYQDRIALEMYPEFIAAEKLARLSYAFPQMWYEAMQRYPDVTRWFYEILQGLEGYPGLLTRLKSQVGKLLKNHFRDKIGFVLKKLLS